MSIPAVFRYPALPVYPSLPPVGLRVDQMVAQLGQQTVIRPDGLVLMNQLLVEQLVRMREAVLPTLYQLLSQTQSIPAIVEGLYTAQRLAEVQVPNVKVLYGATSRLNTHPNPLVQIYLAGFYRKLNIPETFGPLLSTLIHHSIYQYPTTSLYGDLREEVGGALLQQLAEKTAEETVKRLQAPRPAN